jgi:hypothetical protein
MKRREQESDQGIAKKTLSTHQEDIFKDSEAMLGLLPFICRSWLAAPEFMIVSRLKDF